MNAKTIQPAGEGPRELSSTEPTEQPSGSVGTNEEIARLRQELTSAQQEIARLRGQSSSDAPESGSLLDAQRMRETLDHLLEGCQILGFDYRYLYINDAAERHNRRSKAELLGRRYMEMWPGIEQTKVFELIQDCLEMRRSHAMENEFVFPDGRLGYFELRIEPVPDGVFILSMNITERREAELERESLRKQLVEAQTMEAVGRLSGGLAHDFNNMLGIIISQSEVVMDELGANHSLASDLERIAEAAQQCGDIVAQLLAISRRQPATPREIDLNAAISKLYGMLGRLFGSKMTLMFQPGKALWPVHIDPSQVDRLLVNLVLNARDAISECGRVTISTANVLEPAAGRDAVDREYVRLSVEDDGAGMDAETRARMFEPFFTTKRPGKGTGLGLSTVYGMVTQNSGRIQVWSEPGRGTRITIDFPRYVAGPAPERQKPPTAADASVDNNQGSDAETILIVDDEAAMLHVTALVVRGFGYRVLTAGSAHAALALARSHTGPIHLLLSDVILPDKSGPELVRQLQALRPEMGVLYMSGYTGDNMSTHGLLSPAVELIQKPYSHATLRARLRQQIDRHRGRALWGHP